MGRLVAGDLHGIGFIHATSLRFVAAVFRVRLASAACDGNKTRAAQRLGITYRGLTMKMQRYGMTDTGERAAG